MCCPAPVTSPPGTAGAELGKEQEPRPAIAQSGRGLQAGGLNTGPVASEVSLNTVLTLSELLIDAAVAEAIKIL